MRFHHHHREEAQLTAVTLVLYVEGSSQTQHKRRASIPPGRQGMRDPCLVSAQHLFVLACSLLRLYLTFRHCILSHGGM